jgi:hypothetical protein
MKNILTLLFFVILLFGCEKENAILKEIEQQEQFEMEALQCSFKTDNIQDLGSHFIIDNDMAIDKNELLQSKINNDLNNKTEEWVVNPEQVVFAVNSLGFIKYYVQPTLADIPDGAEWMTAIYDAIQQWNNITNCRIYFTVTNTPSTADLIFYPVKSYDGSIGYPENLPTFFELPASCVLLDCNTIARSAFPLGGHVGKWIVIPACDTDYSLTERTNTMAHEIGHILGLRHASLGCIGGEEPEYDLGCPSSPIYGANLMWGTPACDNNSLMKATGDNTFNEHDKKVARMLYPEPSVKPTINYVQTTSCGTHCRVWTVSIGNPLPWYQYKLMLYKPSTSQIVKSSEFKLGNVLIPTISYNVAGSYQLYIYATSYQGDVTTQSAKYNLVIP